jgi:hypothetical protein
MSERRDQIAALLAADAGRWQFCRADMNSMRQAIGLLARALRDLPGDRLADRSTGRRRCPGCPACCREPDTPA